MSPTPDHPHILTARDLLKTADMLQKQAAMMEKQARAVAAAYGAEADRQHYMDRLKTIGLDAAKAVGFDKERLDSVVFATAIRHGIPPETVTYYGKLAIRSEAQRKRAIRDREILRLAHLGHGNPAIAERLDISKRTVSRAIVRAYRSGPQPPVR